MTNARADRRARIDAVMERVTALDMTMAEIANLANLHPVTVRRANATGQIGVKALRALEDALTKIERVAA